MKNNGLTREESIRLEAYLLSEKAGHPTGMEQFFWMQAESIVQKRSTTAMPVAKAAPKKPRVKKVAATAERKPTAKQKGAKSEKAARADNAPAATTGTPAATKPKPATAMAAKHSAAPKKTLRAPSIAAK